MSAVTAGWLGASIDEFRAIRSIEPPALHERILRSRIDKVTLRARARRAADLVAIDATMDALAASGLRVGFQQLRVTVRFQRMPGRKEKYAPGYRRNFEFRDVRDDTLVAVIGIGLIQGRTTHADKVRVEIEGQGCLRGYVLPLLGLVHLDWLRPGSLRWDADVAVDLDVPPAALTILDRGRGPVRRVRTFAPDGFTATESLGGGLELGSRESRASAVLYDKRAQIRESLDVADPVQALTPLAAEYSRPKVPHNHLTRVEVRVRGVSSVGALADAVRRAAGRYRVVDLRRVRIADGADETIVVRAREHGVSRTLPGAQEARERLEILREFARSPPKAGKPLTKAKEADGKFPKREFAGLGAAVQNALIAAGLRNHTAHAHSRAVVSRALALLNAASDATDLDLADALLAGVADDLAAMGLAFP
jgi:hypothetical protein